MNSGFLIAADDFATLSPSTQAELLSIVIRRQPIGAPAQPFQASPAVGEAYSGIDMTACVDLSPAQVKEWMMAASDRTKSGLRIIAEQGPIVPAQSLVDAGFRNLSHFQSRVTIRTRTVTGSPGVFLLGLSEGDFDADKVPVTGKYAVTPKTFHSLREYFGIGSA